MDRIGNEVERALARTGGGQGAALAAITAAWPTAVGDAIARNAWPLRISRDGTLHVAAASATWAFELDRMSAEIRERIAAAVGDLAPPAVRFRVGPIPEPPPERDKRPAAVSPEAFVATPEATDVASSAAAAIEDDELRDLVARAARASLSRARSLRRF
jgi:hypothetical protein